MKIIYKYLLPIRRDSSIYYKSFPIQEMLLPTDIRTVYLPEGAEILSVQAQDNQVMLWALGDPDNPDKLRYFRMLMTGAPFELTPNMKFIDTVQLYHGSIVLHIFEIMSKEAYD